MVWPSGATSRDSQVASDTSNATVRVVVSGSESIFFLAESTTLDAGRGTRDASSVRLVKAWVNAGSTTAHTVAVNTRRMVISRYERRRDRTTEKLTSSSKDVKQRRQAKTSSTYVVARRCCSTFSLD